MNFAPKCSGDTPYFPAYITLSASVIVFCWTVRKFMQSFARPSSYRECQTMSVWQFQSEKQWLALSALVGYSITMAQDRSVYKSHTHKRTQRDTHSLSNLWMDSLQSRAASRLGLCCDVVRSPVRIDGAFI